MLRKEVSTEPGLITSDQMRRVPVHAEFFDRTRRRGTQDPGVAGHYTGGLEKLQIIVREMFSSWHQRSDQMNL